MIKSFEVFEVELGLQSVVYAAAEEDVEVVLARDYLQLATVAKVQQEEEQAVSNLGDDGGGEAVAAGIGVVEGPDQVHHRKHTAIRGVGLAGSGEEVFHLEFHHLSPFAVVSLEFISYLIAVVIMNSWTCVERVIHNYFHLCPVGCNDEPMQVVVVDKEDEFVVAGIILPKVALAVHEDCCL